MNMATKNKTTKQLIVESIICAGFGFLFTALLVVAHILSEYI